MSWKDELGAGLILVMRHEEQGKTGSKDICALHLSLFLADIQHHTIPIQSNTHTILLVLQTQTTRRLFFGHILSG